MTIVLNYDIIKNSLSNVIDLLESNSISTGNLVYLGQGNDAKCALFA